MPLFLIVKAPQRGSIKPGSKYHRRWWDGKANEWRYEYYEAQHRDDHKGAAAAVFGHNDGNLRVGLEYGDAHKETVKAHSTGRKFDPDSKMWIVPPANYPALEKKLGHVVVSEKAHATLKGAGIHIDGQTPEPAAEKPQEFTPQVERLKEAQAAMPKPAEPQFDPDGYPTTDYAISEEYTAKLFPEQVIDVKRVLGRWKAGHKGIVLANGTGTGKGVPLDTLLPTPGGFKKAGDVRQGDYLISVDGQPTQVELVSPVHNLPCYRVKFDDDTELVVDETHLWQVDRWKGGAGWGKEEVHTTRDLLKYGVMYSGQRKRFRIPLAAPAEYPEASLPIDPYLLGVWLGDGTASTGSITNPDDEILEALKTKGYELAVYDDEEKCRRICVRGLMVQLRELGVLNNKHIPEAYLTASVAQRLELLRGLMDTDGTANTNRNCCFDNTTEALARGVRELVHSLGMKAGFSSRVGKLNGKEHKVCYRVNFTPTIRVFRLARKHQQSWADQRRETIRYRFIRSIESVDSVPTVCFRVSHPSHLYLASRQYIVTHNTFIYATAIREWADKGEKPLLILPNQDLIAQVHEAMDYLGVPKDAAKIITYAEMRKGNIKSGEHGVLVFDEAHKIKKMFGSDKSKQGEQALELIKGARYTCFATATPFEDLEQAKFLSWSGLMPKGQRFDDWIQGYGYKIVSGYNNSKEYHFGGKPEDLKRAHADLLKRGFLTKRMFEPPAGMTSSESPAIEIDPKHLQLMNEVSKRLTDAYERSGKSLFMAYRTNLLRGILERAKAQATIPYIKAELDKGQSVAVFCQYKADKESNPLEEALEDSEGAGDKFGEQVKRILAGLDLNLPSPTNLIAEAFKDIPGGVGLYTGDVSQAKLKKAKEAFNSGSQKLLVLTGAKGGTGLSFHDLKGGRPTTQFVVTLPWTASELDQMLGRAIRKGMKSDVKVMFPISEAGFEKKLSAILGNRLKSMGFTVRGALEGVSAELMEAFEYGYHKAKKGGMEKMLEAMKLPEASSTPEAPKPTEPPNPGLEQALPLNLFGEPQKEPWKKEPKKKAKPLMVQRGAVTSVPPKPPQPRTKVKDDPNYEAMRYRLFQPDTGKTREVTTYRKKGKAPPRKAKPIEQKSLFDFSKAARLVLRIRRGAL